MMTILLFLLAGAAAAFAVDRHNARHEHLHDGSADKLKVLFCLLGTAVAVSSCAHPPNAVGTHLISVFEDSGAVMGQVDTSTGAIRTYDSTTREQVVLALLAQIQRLQTPPQVAPKVAPKEVKKSKKPVSTKEKK